MVQSTYLSIIIQEVSIADHHRPHIITPAKLTSELRAAGKQDNTRVRKEECIWYQWGRKAEAREESAGKQEDPEDSKALDRQDSSSGRAWGTETKRGDKC